MKYRVTPQFYLVLLAIALLIVYIFKDDIFGTSEIAVVFSGSSSEERVLDAVIVRDEVVVSESQVIRMDFVAPERTIVQAGETCAYVYTAEYSSKVISALNTTRKNIQVYHKIVLGDELDSTLEALNNTVENIALELKGAVTGTARGNILKITAQLEEAMEARRSHMSSTKRSDTKPIKYYDDEKQQLNSISTWQTAKTAPFEGVVSFYLDGYEGALNADTVANLSIEDAYNVLAGVPMTTTSAKNSTNLFRVVDQNHWYVLLLSEDATWNPMQNDVYTFIIDGYDDIVYEGTVTTVRKSGNKVMAQVEVTQPIDSLLYTRTGTASTGTDLTGFAVTKNAISTVNGQTGVWVYDVPGGTFVQVEVILSRSDGTVLFKPLAEGLISVGTQVLIK